MLHQVRRAIAPRLPLAGVLGDWTRLAQRLAEAPRKRQAASQRHQ